MLLDATTRRQLPEARPLVVASVTSDAQLTLKRPFAAEAGCGSTWFAYRINPHVDQSGMFEQAHEALYSGKAIGMYAHAALILPVRATMPPSARHRASTVALTLMSLALTAYL